MWKHSDVHNEVTWAKKCFKNKCKGAQSYLSSIIVWIYAFHWGEGRKIRSVATYKGNKRLDARDKRRVSDMFGFIFCCYCWKTAKTTPTLLAGDLSEFLLWTRSWSIRRQKRAFLVKYSNPPSPSHPFDILSQCFVHLPKQITEAVHCGWLQLAGFEGTPN